MATDVTDIDLRDFHARAHLHTALRARREHLGWSQRRTGQACGRDAAVIRRMERHGVDRSYAATIMGWARALGMRLVMTPVGFPEPAASGGTINNLLAALNPSIAGDDWAIARLAHDLAGIRHACHVTQRQLAQQCGVSNRAVSAVETAGSSSALVVLQRHARGVARCAWLPDAHLSVYLSTPTEPDTPLV